MKWVTRHHIRVNRAATACRCSFEALVAERLAEDRALVAMAAIVHGADFPDDISSTPESAGLRAISSGLPLTTADDQEVLERASVVYDALYAHLAEREGAA